MTRKIHGFMVVEACDDWEQVLALDESPGLPRGGVLRWAQSSFRRTLFRSRKVARKAINRTEHYRRAYEDGNCPEARLCRIEPVVMVEASGRHGAPPCSIAPPAEARIATDL